jgi:Divergent InlB B-repeat domain
MSKVDHNRAVVLLALTVAYVILAPVGAPAAALPQIPVRTTPAGEFQPARNHDSLAWEQNTRARPNQYDVMVQSDGHPAVQANQGKGSAAMGDFVGDRLIYQQYKGNPYQRGRSDLFFYDLVSGTRSKVPGGHSRQWEYWPSASDGWLLFARWRPANEVRRLFLQHLDTGERRLLEKTKGRRAFIGPGQVNGNYAVWSVCRRRCDVIRYDIAAHTDARIENPGSYQRAPSVTPGGTVYFSRGGNRCGVSVKLVRAPMQGPQEVLVELQKGLDIRDTYTHIEPNGSIEVYFERNVCGRTAASDIYKVREPALASLTVGLAGTGAGTVTSSPPGIHCGDDCAEDYERGTEVTLTAGASPGSAFVAWSGACTGSASCQITMDDAKDVTATFLIQGAVTIIKDSIPDHEQNFEFVHNLGGSLTFFLDDDPSSALMNLKTISPPGPGTYQVRELLPGSELPQGSDWELTGIQCLDLDGNSTGDVDTGVATIRLDPGEGALCTFTNEED